MPHKNTENVYKRNKYKLAILNSKPCNEWQTIKGLQRPMLRLNAYDVSIINISILISDINCIMIVVQMIHGQFNLKLLNCCIFKKFNFNFLTSHCDMFKRKE